MLRKRPISIALMTPALIGGIFFLILVGCSKPAPVETVAARKGEIRVVTRTNGIVEPLDSTRIYAFIDGFIKSIECSEGSQTAPGQVLFRMNAPQTRIALAEARAALLETERQAKAVLEGPPKEESDSLDATLEEALLQLRQLTENLSAEEALLAKGAVSTESVESLRQQKSLLDVRIAALKKKKEDLLTRYSEADKQLMRDKVKQLTDQVQLLEKQLQNASVVSPVSGLIYALEVKPGAFVTTGQLLAQIYQPGQVRLRAYVDEPDLGRIRPGQKVAIEWDGMPDTKWDGTVEKPPERVVALNNRSVGYVLCSIDGATKELMPDLNVSVEIETAVKKDALIVPRSCVFNNEGQSVVLLPKGKQTAMKPVVTGLTTYEEIEILDGLQPGDPVVLNPLNVIPQE